MLALAAVLSAETTDVLAAVRLAETTDVLAAVRLAETTDMLATVRWAKTTDVHFLTYLGSRSPKTKVLIRGVGSLRPPSLAL